MSLRILTIFTLWCCSADLWAQQFNYLVTDKKPFSRMIFTQGLEIVDGQLYVSSGGYGNSRLMRFNLENGSLEGEHRLQPHLFAEGLTVVGDRVYQLTWRARQLIVYNRSDLSVIERWQIPGEGWGLTHNGKMLIYSDGSDRLHYVSAAKKRIERVVSVTENGDPVSQINELEWVEGKIWANIWGSDRIIIIDPDSGSVTGSANLQGLLPKAERRPDTNVLNGIARNPADGTIWVTGKKWPWMYQIELVAQTENTGQEATP